YIRKEFFVFFLHCRPICAMHIFYIKIFFLHSPNLMEDLFPLSSWIYQLFDVIQVDFSSFRSCWFLASIHDVITSSSTVNHFFAIGTDLKSSSTFHQGSVFFFLQIVDPDGSA